MILISTPTLGPALQCASTLLAEKIRRCNYYVKLRSIELLLLLALQALSEHDSLRSLGG